MLLQLDVIVQSVLGVPSRGELFRVFASHNWNLSINLKRNSET